jgi:hypothetical protein
MRFCVRLLILSVLVFMFGGYKKAHADGLASIEFENDTSKETEVSIGDNKFKIKAGATKRVNLAPGVYECTWGPHVVRHVLKHGDVKVVKLNRPVEKGITKKDDPPPTPKEPPQPPRATVKVKEPEGDGVGLIELKNDSDKDVQVQVGDKSYDVKAKSSHRVFVKPGDYKCKWGDQEISCSLNHGDITVVTVGGGRAVARKEEQPEQPVKPSPPAIKPKEESTKEPEAVKIKPKVDPRIATLVVRVHPKATRFWIDDILEKKITPDKQEYHFHTPPLEIGLSYYYIVTMEIDGVRYVRRIYIRAGTTSTLDWTK